MRVKHGHYKYKTPFRAHSFLSDVPLHDVWAILLHARGPKRNIQDVRRVLASLRTEHPDPLVAFFLRARQRLGRIFEWDDDNHGTPGQLLRAPSHAGRPRPLFRAAGDNRSSLRLSACSTSLRTRPPSKSLTAQGSPSTSSQWNLWPKATFFMPQST